MPTVGTGFDFLLNEGPSIFGTDVCSMLYVGHRSDTHPWWYKTFAPVIGVYRLAVVDISYPNLMSARHITQELYLGDVRQDDLPRDFGIVFWDEGPEHLPKEVALDVIRLLRERNQRVLTSCPWGFQPQGSGPNDPEFHHWGPEPADFEAIGMQTRTFGTRFDGRGDGHGNLIAWI